ncbi:hypothetical protein [Streptantibioticus ferralitis]|uniref:Uncharacterized protein n=1 Tax=Streptantibioticus ferralitis TaxID=236510 RepID=A0ABT5Z1F3_9ACTN|nr:hypothetical protein [Streptantibioticus ferralitis]MDF2257674.1 hypothetical protein [Streptantibioticus ferralitis]
MEFFLSLLVGELRGRAAWLREHARDDAGYSTETVIITALLAALGIAAVAVITAKVMAKAHGINLG